MKKLTLKLMCFSCLSVSLDVWGSSSMPILDINESRKNIQELQCKIDLLFGQEKYEDVPALLQGLKRFKNEFKDIYGQPFDEEEFKGLDDLYQASLSPEKQSLQIICDTFLETFLENPLTYLPQLLDSVMFYHRSTNRQKEEEVVQAVIAQLSPEAVEKFQQTIAQSKEEMTIKNLEHFMGIFSKKYQLKIKAMDDRKEAGEKLKEFLKKRESILKNLKDSKIEFLSLISEHTDIMEDLKQDIRALENCGEKELKCIESLYTVTRFQDPSNQDDVELYKSMIEIFWINDKLDSLDEKYKKLCSLDDPKITKERDQEYKEMILIIEQQFTIRSRLKELLKIVLPEEEWRESVESIERPLKRLKCDLFYIYFSLKDNENLKKIADEVVKYVDEDPEKFGYLLENIALYFFTQGQTERMENLGNSSRADTLFIFLLFQKETGKPYKRQDIKDKIKKYLNKDDVKINNFMCIVLYLKEWILTELGRHIDEVIDFLGFKKKYFYTLFLLSLGKKFDETDQETLKKIEKFMEFENPYEDLKMGIMDYFKRGFLHYFYNLDHEKMSFCRAILKRHHYFKSAIEDIYKETQELFEKEKFQDVSDHLKEIFKLIEGEAGFDLEREKYQDLQNLCREKLFEPIDLQQTLEDLEEEVRVLQETFRNMLDKKNNKEMTEAFEVLLSARQDLKKRKPQDIQKIEKDEASDLPQVYRAYVKIKNLEKAKVILDLMILYHPSKDFLNTLHDCFIAKKEGKSLKVITKHLSLHHRFFASLFMKGKKLNTCLREIKDELEAIADKKPFLQKIREIKMLFDNADFNLAVNETIERLELKNEMEKLTNSKNKKKKTNSKKKKNFIISSKAEEGETDEEQASLSTQIDGSKDSSIDLSSHGIQESEVKDSLIPESFYLPPSFYTSYTQKEIGMLKKNEEYKIFSKDISYEIEKKFGKIK